MGIDQSLKLRLLLLSSAALLSPALANAQDGRSSEPVLLESITVTAPAPRPRPAQVTSPASARRGARTVAPAPAPAGATLPVEPSGDTAGQGGDAAEGDGVAASQRFNPPSFAAQQRRALRRPGAETVVSVKRQDPGLKNNLRQVLEEAPGVYITQRSGENSQGTVSIRGSDVSQSGLRGGRGVRGFIDGVPIGRLGTGITVQAVDLKATDYIEVYRGASSLRYGALATGGALNFVSKTGLSAPGVGISASGGSFNNRQSQIELGGAKGAFDWYFQVNDYYDGGYEFHSRNYAPRFSANVGWRPTENIESRTYVSAGKNLQELPTTVPLNQLDQFRQSGYDPTNASFPYNLRADFDNQRVVNKTVIRFGSSAFEIAPYYLRTGLEMVPNTSAGINDVVWNDYGVSLRFENKSDLFGLPTEFVAGYRPTYEDATYKTYQWARGSAMNTKAALAYNDVFHAWFHEGYAEMATEIAPRLRLFNGVQAFWTNRIYHDAYSGPAFLSGSLTGTSIGIGPGSSNGLRNYEREFSAFNPKFGLNWEYASNHFLFANYARSTEVPNVGDFSSLLSLQQAVNGLVMGLPPIRPVNLDLINGLQMQRAWTAEAGVRGGWDRFRYDVTLYNMRLNDEILSACALGFIPLNNFRGPNQPRAFQRPDQQAQLRGQFGCSNSNSLIPFNVDQTMRNGLETGFKTKPFVDVFSPNDHVFLDVVWNYIDSRFVDDPTFGNARLPLTPRHQLFSELGYRHPAGFYLAGNLRFLSDRWSTFDNSGGDAFIVPSYMLYGARVGWKAPDQSWSLWAEGRNLTDVAYAGDFNPILRAADAPVPPGGTPFVYPGTGRAFYAGITKRFN